jgi:dipeptidyl aminopeptidase/acylaminoacyl peptidase
MKEERMSRFRGLFRPAPLLGTVHGAVPAILAVLAVTAVVVVPSAAAPASSPYSKEASATTAPATAADADAPVKQYSIEQFLSTTNWRGASFSPDGQTLLASSDQSGVFNAYAVPAAGGAPVELTDSKLNAIQALGYFPDGKRFLYSSDRGGDEKTHLFVRDAAGTARDLTPGDKLKAELIDWSLDDRSFFYATNERDPRYFDAFEMSVDGYEKTLLYTNEEGYDVAAISPDRRWLALDKSGDSTEDSDVYLYDRSAKKLQRLTPHQGQVSNAAATFSPDGKSLYYVTDEGSEWKHLMSYDLASGARADVLRPDWDVIAAHFSRDGRYFLVAINRDARTETHLFAMPGMHPVPLPEVPDADVTGGVFSRDGKRLAFYAESSRQPRNLFVYDLGGFEGAAGGRPRQLTRSLNPAIDPSHLVAAQVVRFRSYDGVEIPGLVYRPHGASAGHKAPALVWVHGGPGGQSRIGYGALTQYLVNHGYAVYAINNRGSSGYGKTFFSLADRKHGDADLGDCVASKGMLTATGWVRADRIGILGGSYGGYMVLAALAFRPREFEVGVDLFGVANWVRTLESIPPWWTSFRNALYKQIGDPKADHDYLVKISPLFHAEKIERPLIVLQGENDPRVLRQESDEIVAAARKRGTPVEYLIFPNEGHGFARKETNEKADKAILDFLDKYLKAGAGA